MRNRLSLSTNYLLVILFLMYSGKGFSQVKFVDPIAVNTLDGLPSNNVTAIEKDPEGFMWIGTKKGLARYDGTIIVNFLHDENNDNTISNNHILDVLVDTINQKVWVAHADGLSTYDPIKKVFKNYDSDEQNPNSVPPYRAYRIFQDKSGNIWIGFQAGGLLLYRPERDDFERFLCFDEETQKIIPICDHGVWVIKEDISNDHLLWVGTHFGLFKFNKLTKEGEHFVFEFEEEVVEFQINNINSLLPHPNGKIYFGTTFQGLVTLDPESGVFSRITPCYENGTSPLGKIIIRNLYMKSSDELWISTDRGLQLYNIRTNCITQSFKNSKKETFRVDYIDDSGRVWNASTTLGLLIYNPLFQQTTSTSFEEENSTFDPRVRRILEDPATHQLFVAADESRGLYILNQRTNEWQCIPPPKDYDLEERSGFRIKDMTLLDDGSLLIVEDSKLYWYEPGFERLKEYPIQFPAKAPRLRNVIISQDGYYWLSSFSFGVNKLNDDDQQYYSLDDQINQLERKVATGDLTEDKFGNIWIREHNGLLIYERAKDQLIFHPHDPKVLNLFRRMGGLESDPDGNIWMATRSEFLGHARSDSLEKGILQLYGKGNGLKGKEVNLVKPYKGKVLVFTELGLQVFNPTSKKFEADFDATFGIGGAVEAACLLSNGQLAVGSNKTITFFHPDNLKTNREIPQPYVSGFRVFDEVWKLKGLPSQSDSVYLSYKQNFFSFDISSIAFNQPDKTKLKYKLEPFESSWQDGTKRKFAAYTNVPGGNYRFIIQAVNGEGESIGPPSLTYLYISTVWYKTTWFWTLAIILLGSIAYLFYRWRIQQVRREENVKVQYERELADVKMSALRAQMNPHFIFNSLNSIEYYIINNEQDKAVDYLGRFSRLIRLILQNSKSSVIPVKDELEALKIYMEMESMRFDHLFDYEIKTEAGLNIEGVEIPPMIIQPYVENAIWHGLMQKKNEKGKIELILRQIKNAILCIVEDNGIGRDAANKLKSKSATKRKSFGMRITSDRLDMLNKLTNANAAVQVFDLKNDDGSAAGTRVEIIIPLADVN